VATAIAFPGQGAQRVGMGRPWVDHAAWAVVDRAEEAAERPLAPLLLDADEQELARTSNAQLAMLVHGLVVWEAVRPRIDDHIVAFAGHSLGQLTALIAAGAVPFDAGVRIGVARAEATQAAADDNPGAMAAVLGLDVDRVTAVCEAAAPGVWVANDNAPGQVAVGGAPDAVERAIDEARKAGAKRVVPLDVGGAFHTPLMAAAAEDLGPVLAEAPFMDTTVPVVANHDAQPHLDGPGWVDRLTRHLVEPVRWRESATTLGDLGADRMLEVGASRLLSPLVRRSCPEIDVAGVGLPTEIDDVVAGVAA
jgi:[acyl-carrier-protein] S-malonyltransferase